ncbi:MAG: hypothetical protein RLZZ144_734 [Pseudomonadota bacterium]|jgi:hypothetical protein
MKKTIAYQVVSLSCLFLLATHSVLAEENQLIINSGFEYSEGRYGGDSTSTNQTIPINIIYLNWPWSYKIGSSMVRTTGESTVISSGRVMGRRNTSTTTTTLTKQNTSQSGLGDTLTAVSYNLYSNDAFDSGVDLTLRAKLATAQASLGTGQNDYATQLFIFETFNQFSTTLLIGYEVLGSSTDNPMNNIGFGSISGGYTFSNNTSIGAEWRYAQQATALGAEELELKLYLAQQLSDQFTLRSTLRKGYSIGSPDFGVIFSLSRLY